MTALQEFSQLHKRSNSFEPLVEIMRGNDTQSVAFAMCLVSTMLNNREDGKLRLSVREQLLSVNFNTTVSPERREKSVGVRNDRSDV